MLGALGLLLVGLLAYLIVSLVRYRAAMKRVRAARAEELEGEARYLSPSVEHAEDVFAVPVAGTEATPTDSLHSKVFDFDIPQVHVPPSQPAQSTPLEQQVVLAPEPVPETEVLPVPTTEPEPEPEPQLVSQPTILEDLSSLDLEPELPGEPAQVFSAEPASEPEPAPAPAPEPALEPEPEPAPAPLPGYSLADELERLMAAATTVSAPLLTPAEHQAVVTQSPSEAPEPEPQFEVAPEPLFPAPSTGQALSTAAPAPPVREAQPEPAPEPRPPSAPRPQAVVSSVPPPMNVPEYTLVAPVELHFTVGQSRIGVKPGTRSYAEFQRLAGILLDDLRTSRGW